MTTTSPTGAASIRIVAAGVAWDALVTLLPPKHHILVSGPWSDGHVTVHVISQMRFPSRVRVAARGMSLADALILAHNDLSIELQSQPEAAVATTTKGRSKNGRFVAKDSGTPDESGPTHETAPGFTRDRDLVGYLVYKNGRTSQYELRFQHGIKNPAQAINDAEMHFHFTVKTGDRMPNGDIPYTLIGSVPAIAGTMPMFNTGIDDPDEKFYVLELDLYNCVECGRHPVYRPQQADTGYTGVCPRHGPSSFKRV